jgi:hypothetical protein
MGSTIVPHYTCIVKTKELDPICRGDTTSMMKKHGMKP